MFTIRRSDNSCSTHDQTYTLNLDFVFFRFYFSHYYIVVLRAFSVPQISLHPDNVLISSSISYYKS